MGVGEELTSLSACSTVEALVAPVLGWVVRRWPRLVARSIG